MKNKIFVATPIYGGVAHIEYFMSLQKLFGLCEQLGIQYEFFYISKESLITRARNDLVHAFLKSDATHLLFIDSDIAFDEKHVIEMLYSDKEIICGLYPKKNLLLNELVNVAKNGIEDEYIIAAAHEYVFNNTDKTQTIKLGSMDLVEVDAAGTGFMMIKKEVFDLVQNKKQTYVNNSLHNGETTIDFFGLSVCKQTGILLSEDYAFCQSWKEIGGKIFVAPWILCKHIGHHIFG